MSDACMSLYACGFNAHGQISAFSAGRESRVDCLGFERESGKESGNEKEKEEGMNRDGDGDGDGDGKRDLPVSGGGGGVLGDRGGDDAEDADVDGDDGGVEMAGLKVRDDVLRFRRVVCGCFEGGVGGVSASEDDDDGGGGVRTQSGRVGTAAVRLVFAGWSETAGTSSFL